MGHKWTEPEIIYLKENYYTKPIIEIAEELGLKYQQIVTKAHNLKMNKKKNTGENWSEKEDSFLEKNFEYASNSFLKRELNTRSWISILQRGNKTLKLQRKTQDKYYINHCSFDSWNQEVAYILGFLLADGYIKYSSGERKENSLQIELAEYDIDILMKIKEYLEFEGPIRKTKRGTVVLSVSNCKIIENILSTGYPLTDKTFSAKWLDSVPEEYQRHFIRGIFDGDGSIYLKKEKPCIQFLGTEDILLNVDRVLPVVSSKKPWFRGANGGANVYVTQYQSAYHVKNIYDWMYKDATIYLDRKYQKFQEFLVAELKSRELLER